jgi:signal transduction histidine kinase
LKLARLEMGAETYEHASVDLGALVAELLRSQAAVQRERDVRVENELPAEVRVEGDREVLRIVASNLLGNALYYSPSGGRVQCRLERAPDGWRFLVENASSELQPADLGALAEPFWRKDGARVDRDRSGLGLALSRALAEKTGMRLTFELDAGRFRAILAGRANGDGRG